MEFWYEDDEGVQQGPYPAESMAAWFSDDFFDGDTRVATASEGPFTALSAHPQRALIMGEAAAGAGDAAEIVKPDVSAALARGGEDTRGDNIAGTGGEGGGSGGGGNSDEWFYLDDEGVERGPYPADDLQSWYSAGYFTADTRVRRGDEPVTAFARIGDRKDVDAITAALPADDGEGGAGGDGLEFEVDDAAYGSGASATARGVAAPVAPRPEGADQQAALAPAPVPRIVDPDDEPVWFYLDDAGVETGPWGGRQMQFWFEAGWFAIDTRVRRLPSEEHTPLADLRLGPAPAAAAADMRPLVKLIGFTRASAARAPPNPHVVPSAAQEAAAAAAHAQAHQQAMRATAVLGPPQWVYLDAQGQQQGPWPEDTMRQWWAKGMLATTVRVRRADEPPTAPWVAIGARADAAFTRAAPIARGMGGPAHHHQAAGGGRGGRGRSSDNRGGGRTAGRGGGFFRGRGRGRGRGPQAPDRSDPLQAATLDG